MKPAFYFEVQPLFDRFYSGIPQVAVSLIKRLLDDQEVQPHFFFEDKCVPVSLVELALQDNSGVRFRSMFNIFSADLVPAENSIAIYPNFKSGVCSFDAEAFILHDMSVFRMPEFHTKENVQLVRNRLRRDISTSDIVFCVSESTKKEYEAIAQSSSLDKLKVVLNGIEKPTIKKYLNHEKAIITILGTLEPRKNIEIVLKLISIHKSKLLNYQFIFPGKYGWGSPVQKIISDLELQDCIQSEQIVFPGFITETEKEVLLNSTALLIYPSVYEGFGLPVGEALIRNVPVLTTTSTSIPEVGGQDAKYFDAHDFTDFERKFFDVITNGDLSTNSETAGRIEKIFSWDVAYNEMKKALITTLEKKRAAKMG